MTMMECLLELKGRGFKTLCGMEDQDTGFDIEDIDEYIAAWRWKMENKIFPTCCEQGYVCELRECSRGVVIMWICEDREFLIYATHKYIFDARSDYFGLDDED